MNQRRPVLLLEFLIALLIMGGILEMLFVGYRHATLGIEKARIEKETCLKNERLQRRLYLLFQTVESCKVAAAGEFFLKYQGGADHDARFRGPLEGCLYIDKKRLVLVSRPGKGEPRVEVLHDNVASIGLYFFDVKSGSFIDIFPSVKPSMMKIHVAMQDGPNLTLPLFL